MPVVVLGHNGRAAWGFTNTGADTQDLFLEKLDPEDPARYLTPDGYRRFDVRREVIRVKDGDDVAMRVRESRHGPVLDDAWGPAARASPPGHVLALGWTALREDDLTLEAGLGLPEARDWASFVENLRDFHSPPQNVSYADVDGDVGFLVPGRIPIRPARPGPETGTAPGTGPDPDWMDRIRPGTVPRPGWTGDHDWLGFVPYEALPRVHNPPGGAVVTANHPVTAGDPPHPLTFEWAAGFRAERIMERLAARPRHDAESFRALQQDRVSPFARALLPRLRRVPLSAEAGPLARRARGLLDAWDGDMDPDRPEPLVFQTWIWTFGELVTADELGAVQREAWGRKGAFLRRILETRGVWCDDVGTAPVETCDEMLARALGQAVRRIAERQGDDPADWRWGREHVALGEHRPLGSSPFAPVFNLRGPAPGGIYTVNAFEFSPLDDEEPFVSRNGPSLRGHLRPLRPRPVALHALDRPVRERALAPLRQLRGGLAEGRVRDHSHAARSVRARGHWPPPAHPALRLGPHRTWHPFRPPLHPVSRPASPACANSVTLRPRQLPVFTNCRCHNAAVDNLRGQIIKLPGPTAVGW